MVLDYFVKNITSISRMRELIGYEPDFKDGTIMGSISLIDRYLEDYLEHLGTKVFYTMISVTEHYLIELISNFMMAMQVVTESFANYCMV